VAQPPPPTGLNRHDIVGEISFKAGGEVFLWIDWTNHESMHATVSDEPLPRKNVHTCTNPLRKFILLDQRTYVHSHLFIPRTPDAAIWAVEKCKNTCGEHPTEKRFIRYFFFGVPAPHDIHALPH